MTGITLYIGDKTLSSWSLRPWLALKQAGIPYTEQSIGLDRPTSKNEILAKSPSGLVPCLVHGEIVVWDSLAILEYVAETFPEKSLWPAEKAARARARSISAEMHSGFGELRKVWPMNFTRTGLRHLCPPGVRKDVERIAEIWTDARTRFGAGGPFLFGRFSVADAMFAPVASRFATYGPVSLPPDAADYQKTMLELDAMKEWGDGAAAEQSRS